MCKYKSICLCCFFEIRKNTRATFFPLSLVIFLFPGEYPHFARDSDCTVHFTRRSFFFFLSTENDLHHNLRLDIGRDIDLHNNSMRSEKLKVWRERALRGDGKGHAMIMGEWTRCSIERKKKKKKRKEN